MPQGIRKIPPLFEKINEEHANRDNDWTKNNKLFDLDFRWEEEYTIKYKSELVEERDFHHRIRWKKMTKRLTGKREDTLLHSAARESVVSGGGESELKEMLAKQNWNSTKAISKPFELLLCHGRI
ncbi:hypothetical protein FH972_002203 [Carpinus fangiana]|uniref:Uncharacterized protein n=1 Tax=Carpinus fangiana TaxID=176857 RepID=A0A5N6QGH8_9ROSI|nr:hypothetical protein FH972_002203 [Carpinus fangiana]